ncbi:MAG: hypothetical protein QW794_05715 [Thermosphaera sp.]
MFDAVECAFFNLFCELDAVAVGLYRKLNLSPWVAGRSIGLSGAVFK